MIVVRPIVNLLFVIYNFVGDFGLAIIIFTILVKLIMWPIVKKQLHQTRLMKKIQPELAEIKKNCKGNRQLESLQMMDLYKRNNIKPFRSILTLIIQLPIFIALYTAVRVVVTPPTDDLSIEKYAYSFVAELPKISDVIDKQNGIKAIIKDNEAISESNQQIAQQNEDKPDDEKEPLVELTPIPRPETKLFGLIDLSEAAGVTSVSSVIIFVFALASAFGQYWMARQQNPSTKKRRTFKQIMKDAQGGKEADQAELNAMVSGQMTKFMPIMMLIIMMNLPGALVFYYMMNNFITIAQQKIILNKSYSDMEESADKSIIKQLNKIEEAQLVDGKKSKQNITKISAKGTKKRRKK